MTKEDCYMTFSGALDLSALITADNGSAWFEVIPPGESRLIKTGIAVNIGRRDLVGILASRSGHGLKHRVLMAVDEFSIETERGVNGFGSSGR